MIYLTRPAKSSSSLEPSTYVVVSACLPHSFYFCSAGIGYQITKQLAAKGATVYLACRSEQRALAAINKLEEEVAGIEGKNRLQFLHVDMSSMDSVKRAAEEFLKRETRLDVLCALLPRVAVSSAD